MKRLVPIEDGDIDTFKSIISRKQGMRRKRLRNIIPLIEDGYLNYAQNVTTLHTLTPLQLGPFQKNDCRHCYSKAAKVAELRETIKNAQSRTASFFCQYCQISQYGDFDHFAPKETFPEYSVLGRNLVPCCSICNGLKGEGWLEGEGLVVMNLYYDEFPDDQYLFAEIEVIDRTAFSKFVLRQPHGMGNALFAKVRRHYSRLNLLQRYAEGAGAKIDESFKTLEKRGRVRGAGDLLQRGTELEEVYGANYWESVLIKSLSQDATFVGLVP